MNHEHVIADEVLDQALIEFSRHNSWLVYNTLSYFLEKTDVYFFKEEEEAREFAANNISEWDAYKVLYARSVEDLLKQIVYGKALEQHLSNSKISIMNEKNLEYLKDNIKYMGFGETLSAALENQLKEGQPEFQLTYATEIHKKPFEAQLNFKRSENSEMYFFNSYQATLQRANGEKAVQKFYLHNGKGITAKEAYNLLEGRAVYKELSNKAGASYKAWLQLDFDKKDKHNNQEVKQFHENYGYDLKAALSKYAIAEMDGGEKEKALLQSLQKGNMQSVAIEKEGSVTKLFVEANPQFKTVTLYDAQMKRMQKEELAQYQSIRPSTEREMKQEQKEELKPDKKKDIKQTTSDDLASPKKKTARKKGMSV
jgi:hypothetical protein